MKRILLSTLILGSIMAFSEAKAQFGVRAGVNFHNITGKDPNGVEYNNNLITRMHAGINYSIPIATDFAIRPEVLYSEKGAKSPNDNKYKLNYLEVPVNLVYKPTLGTGKLLLGFGPYLGFGIGGKVEFANGGPDHDVEFQNNVTTPAANTAYYKPMDAGINTLAGYEFNKLSFQLNAQLGLTNIYGEFSGVQAGTLKNTGFGLSLGYRF